MHPQIKGHASLPSVHQVESIKHHLDLFTPRLSDTNVKPRNYELSIIQWFNSPYIHQQVNTMDATHYGHVHENIQYGMPQSQHYNFGQQISNLTILSNVIEWVYTAFFYSKSAQQLWNLPEEILFSHFVTTLNDTLERKPHTRRWGLWEWEQELKYSHSSQKSTMDIPHFLKWNLSFNPTTPLTTAEEHPEHSPQRFRSHSPVCHHLVFTCSDAESPVRTSDPHLWHPSIPDSNPLHGRAETSFTRQAPHGLPPHTYTKHRWTPSRMLQQKKKDVPTAPLDDDIS